MIVDPLLSHQLIEVKKKMVISRSVTITNSAREGHMLSHDMGLSFFAAASYHHFRRRLGRSTRGQMRGTVKNSTPHRPFG